MNEYFWRRVKESLPLWADPYKAGQTPMRYDSDDYRISQALASNLQLYGALYRFGSEQARMDDYRGNTYWSGYVQYPGLSSVGGYGAVTSGVLNFVSDNIKRLYR